MFSNLSRLIVKLIGCSFSLISIGYPVIFNFGQLSSFCDRIKESNVTTTFLNSTNICIFRRRRKNKQKTKQTLSLACQIPRKYHWDFYKDQQYCLLQCIFVISCSLYFLHSSILNVFGFLSFLVRLL